jgi:hypothetical protein
VIDVLAQRHARTLLLTPDPLVAGLGSTAIFTLTVDQPGRPGPRPSTWQVELPAGWSASRYAATAARSRSVTLPPLSSSTRSNLQLLVTPPAGCGHRCDYPVTARAVAHHQTASRPAATTATVQVIERGVQVAVRLWPGQLWTHAAAAIWEVQVTNSGQRRRQLSDLEAAGTLGQAGDLSPSSVSLNPGASQMVQLRVSDLGALAPQSFLLSVAATSQGDTRIRDQDTTSVSVTGYQAVDVAWTPETQTVDDSLSTQTILNVINQGNVNTVFDLSTAVAGGSKQQLV